MTERASFGWEIARDHRGRVTGRAQFKRGQRSDDDRRYFLSRRWQFDMTQESARVLTWIMLNPSTAGAWEDDATIRKCKGYARRWGYGAIRVLNLFSRIATDAAEMFRHPGWVETANDAANDDTWRFWLTAFGGGMMFDKPDVVVGWGAYGTRMDRDRWAAEFFASAGIEATCLGVTQTGQPLHPGRTSYDLERVPWRGC